MEQGGEGVLERMRDILLEVCGLLPRRNQTLALIATFLVQTVRKPRVFGFDSAQCMLVSAYAPTAFPIFQTVRRSSPLAGLACTS